MPREYNPSVKVDPIPWLAGALEPGELGLDYAGGRPGGHAIRDAGYKFVVRYLSDGGSSLPGKLLTPAEADDLRAHGIEIVSNWETTASWMLGGYQAGVSAAQRAVAQVLRCGGRRNRPIYFAADWDATPQQQAAIDDCLRGCASIIGAGNVGIYGGYWPVKRALDNGTARWAWQTGAWSGSNREPRMNIFQRTGYITVGGVQCDVNEARTPDYGQWGYTGEDDTAFAQYAETHEAASIQRCWSTWNVLCRYLYTSELIRANPMSFVGRPKVAKTLPKALPTDSVAALLAALTSDPVPRRRSDWVERDRALILTGLLAGLRADELVRANVGDLRRADDGAVLHVRGKGGKDRRIPIEPALVQVLEHYLDSRAARFPATAKRRSSPGRGLAAWLPGAPLFVGADGDRISRGTLQYRVLRAFRRAGIDADRARGALVHGLRHTFATELANSDVSVYTLMKLLGHESMVTSQRYVTAAGTETRTAAAQNKLYGLLEQQR